MKKLLVKKGNVVVDQYDIFSTTDYRGDEFSNAIPKLANVQWLEIEGQCMFAIVNDERWGTCKIIRHELQYV